MADLFTVEQLDYLDKHFDTRYNDRYVSIDVCNDNQDQNNKKFANDDTRIKLFEQKMKSWEWMFKLIATGTVGTLITSILSLILK
jgi:hypothetical protein